MPPRCPHVHLRGAHDLPKSYQHCAKTNPGHRNVAPTPRGPPEVHLREREICSEVTFSTSNSEHVAQSPQRFAFHKQFYTFHAHSNRCRQTPSNRGRRWIAVGVFNIDTYAYTQSNSPGRQPIGRFRSLIMMRAPKELALQPPRSSLGLSWNVRGPSKEPPKESISLTIS